MQNHIYIACWSKVICEFASDAPLQFWRFVYSEENLVEFLI